MSKVEYESQGAKSVIRGQEEELVFLRQLRSWFPRAVVLNGSDLLLDLRVHRDKVIIIHHLPMETQSGFRMKPDFTIIHKKKHMLVEHKSQREAGTMQSKMADCYDQIEDSGCKGMVVYNGPGFAPEFIRRTTANAKKRFPSVLGVLNQATEKKSIKATIKKELRIK